MKTTLKSGIELRPALGEHLHWIVQFSQLHLGEYEIGWKRLTRHVGKSSTTTLLICRRGKPIGYVLTQRGKVENRIKQIVIEPFYRRKGVGTEVINYLIEELACEKQPYMSAVVPEKDLPTQLFFRSMGWYYIATEKDKFGWDNDGYVFEFVTEYEELRC